MRLTAIWPICLLDTMTGGSGELSGTYRVLEMIPDGMELAYIRIKWVGGQNFNKIDSKENSDLEASGWTKKTISAATDNGGRSKTTTYYVKDNQALIELGDFTAGKKRDDYSVAVSVLSGNHRTTEETGQKDNQ